MIRVPALVFGLACCLAAVPAAAQFIPPPPELQNRIPAPLPPPPEPPLILGPATEGRLPQAGVAKTPRIKTHHDRTTRCLHQGSGYGLRGADLDAYTRSCVNN
jgi:hypothetical protein